MKNLLKSEFIGEKIEVISDNKKNNIHGIVLDETLSTFKIFHENKIKTIMKQNLKFKIQDSEIFQGSEIRKRPEDRIKK